jgi:hypothetical protein
MNEWSCGRLRKQISFFGKFRNIPENTVNLFIVVEIENLFFLIALIFIPDYLGKFWKIIENESCIRLISINLHPSLIICIFS